MRGLVDDGAAVDDVDDAPRECGIVEPRKERKKHSGGLAEPGGEVERVGDRAAHERCVEAALPRQGGVAGDGAKVREGAHRLHARAHGRCTRPGRATSVMV